MISNRFNLDNNMGFRYVYNLSHLEVPNKKISCLIGSQLKTVEFWSESGQKFGTNYITYIIYLNLINTFCLVKTGYFAV
jgi:hypothetical protein